MVKGSEFLDWGGVSFDQGEQVCGAKGSEVQLSGVNMQQHTTDGVGFSRGVSFFEPNWSRNRKYFH